MNKKTGGQPNIAGVNAQSLASMSLFLQFLRDPKFFHIHLEVPGFQDFNMVFEDDRKIICESKARKSNFSYVNLKEVLDSLLKKGTVNQKDEILIICTNISEDLSSEISYLKYSDGLTDKLKAKKFTKKHLPLLRQVQFWVVPPSFNATVIYSLFAELITFWLPAKDIEKIVNDILIRKIYYGAELATTFSKQDFLKEVDDLASEVKLNSTLYNSELKEVEKQFRVLNKALNNPNHATWKVPKELSAFSADYDKLRFVNDRLSGKVNSISLRAWDSLWALSNLNYVNYAVFDTFSKNLHTEDNIRYVLDYIKKYNKTIRGFYKTDFFNYSVVNILTKIVESDDSKKYLEDLYSIVKDLVIFKDREFFYTKEKRFRDPQGEKGEICRLLLKIYKLSPDKLKDNIFNLVVDSFSLTEDDGQFSHHSPPEVFEILSSWLNEKFVKRFDKIVSVLADQYENFYGKYSKKVQFKGWEHMGSGLSYSGGYHASDRHFIGVLSSAIEKYYENNPKLGWKFIKEKCISVTDQVTRKKPDFLNRSTYQIVLRRYSEEDLKISEESFQILKEFIQSRKGVPHKTDLIYQAVRGMNLSSEKKWRLVSVSLNEYDYPVNPFVEQIVAILADSGHLEARQELKRWFTEEKYYKRFRFGEEIVATIKAVLGKDFDFAIELLNSLLSSEYFRKGNSEMFSSYTVAELLQNILKQDYNKGLKIIRSLESEKVMTKDKQLIFAFSLFNNHGNDTSDSPEILLKTYIDVVDPFLQKHNNDIEKICKVLTQDNAREAFVQFAVRLATNQFFTEAMRIIRVFVNDPDPYLPEDDKEDNKYNEHKRIEDGDEPRNITSVRGWCGWALMKCCVLGGREHIPEIISLSRNLSEDKNYYVIHMSTFALHQLATNKLSVLPENRDILFFNDDRVKALQMSKEVETLAFTLLDKLVLWPTLVQQAMSKSVFHVFDSIRSLNEKDSLKFVKLVATLPVDAIDEVAPLIMYLVEFRKEAYKDWRFKAPGLYDDLGPKEYDDEKFKKILIEIIKKIQTEDPDKCFRFASSAEHLLRESTKDEIKKNNKMALWYFNTLSTSYGHNVFNLIYLAIKNKFQQDDIYLNEWMALYLKCLKTELKFYKSKEKENKLQEVYWFPSFYHSVTLELIKEKVSTDKFLECAKLYFSFPERMEIHESQIVVDTIQEMVKTDKSLNKILDYLFKKNKSKYFYLKNGPKPN